MLGCGFRRLGRTLLDHVTTQKRKEKQKFKLVWSNWIIIDENVIYRKIKKKKCVFAFTGGEGKRRKELRLDK